MFNPLMLLAAEANAVIVLRMMKLMRGGRKRPATAERRLHPLRIIRRQE